MQVITRFASNIEKKVGRLGRSVGTVGYHAARSGLVGGVKKYGFVLSNVLAPVGEASITRIGPDHGLALMGGSLRRTFDETRAFFDEEPGIWLV